MTAWLRLHLVLVFVAVLVIGWTMPGHDRFAFLVGLVFMAAVIALAPLEEEA